MSSASAKQFEKAVKALDVAESALADTLDWEPEIGKMTSEARWARIRSLQAQAQLHILHAISYDLDDIRGSLPDD